MSAKQRKTKPKRRAPGGISITRRGEKYEATYNIPKNQLPEGSTRKRITAWGDSEANATAALIPKLKSTRTGKDVEVISGIKFETKKGTNPRYYWESTAHYASLMSGISETMCLAEWAEDWYFNWIGESVQDSTRKVYKGHIDNYILPFIGGYPMEYLSPRVIKDLWWTPLKNLKKKDKDGFDTSEPLLGNSARSNIYKTLKMLLITANDRMGTRVSLTANLIEIPKVKRPESDRDVKLAAERLRNIFIDNPDRTDPLWSLFALSLIGLRQGERLAIRVQDVDFSDPEDPVIHIHQQLAFSKEEGGWYLKNRTKNGEPRVVPLWGVFLDAVEDRLEMRTKWEASDAWNPDPKYADLLFLQEDGSLWTRRQDTPAWHEFVGGGIRGHLARHVTGLLLAEEEIGLEVAGVLLGHLSDAYRYYYRIASTRVARKELRRIAPRSVGVVKVTSMAQKPRSINLK